jgi:hypothetical protein
MKDLIIALALGLAAASALASGPDARHVLSVTEPQRAHVLEEMRALLSGVQNIVAALGRDDMDAVAHHARPLGMGMAHKAEDHLKGVLPSEFMRLGMSVHEDFDRIAADAVSIKDAKHTLRQLGNTLYKCVACHDAYELRANPTMANQPGAADHRHVH